MDPKHLDTNWLSSARNHLENNGGEDLWYLIFTLLREEKMSFPHFLSKAVEGHGCWAHEGLGYSLDQDWDLPEDFDEVIFFVGDQESSKLSVPDYLLLMKYLVDVYEEIHPDVESDIVVKFDLLRDRCLRRPWCVGK